MNIMKNDTIVITQERMMGWLCFNRFHCIDIKEDLKDRNRKIYIFNDTPMLRKVMGSYNQYKDKIPF